MRWPWMRWRHRKTYWQIHVEDIRWLTEASVILREGWEPFGVSNVPNTTNPNQIRVWLRRPEQTKWRKSYEIKVQSAGWGGHQVMLHLSDGWEPFGVSDSFGNHIIWFRREAT